MVMTDPIADMLTRIRNANQMKHATVSMPASRLKLEILNLDLEFMPKQMNFLKF